MTAPNPSRIAIVVALLCALIPFTWLAVTHRDLPQFGKYQDDGLYLIGAKSLHAGEGFRISSLPGEPAQTKYQPLYSLLLAPLWAADFPGNLEFAAAVQWAVFAAFLLLSFALMRSYGFVPWKCAAMTAFLGFNPWLLYWGLLPVADFLFADLVLAAILFRRHWIAAATLGMAAALTKVAGILLVPAFLFEAWRWKSNRRPYLLAALSTGIAFAAWTLWASSHRSPGEDSVLWYYTDYLGFYLKNGGLAALDRIAPMNLTALALVAGNSILQNLGDFMLGRFFSVVVFAAAISGVRRLVGRTGSASYPLFCGLLMMLLILWNFSPNARLAAPALPLLAMGLWEEGEHLVALISRSLASRKASDRAAAHLIRAGALAGLAAAVFLNLHFIFRGIPELLSTDRSVAAAEQNLFDWCREHLPASSAVMVHNDTRFYLATGLHAVRPVPNSVAFYTGDTAAQLAVFKDLDKFEDHFGLTHIVLTPGDFADFELAQRQKIVQQILSNPRHRQVFELGPAAVLEIQRTRTSLAAQ